jgi:hypothetical protein
MSIILIIVGFILLVLGLLGLGVIRTLRWAKMQQWHAVVEMILGIIVLVIGFMNL